MKLRALSNHVVGWVLVLAPLLAVPAPDAPASGARPALNHLQVTDLGDRLRVEIQTAQAVPYRTATRVSPAAWHLELPTLSRGPALRRMDVNQPPLLEIVPGRGKAPGEPLLLVFRLASPVEPRIRREDHRLLVDFPKPPSAAGRALLRPIAQRTTDGPRREGRQDPRVAPRAPSNRTSVLTKVEVQRSPDSALVTIFGDGLSAYDAKLIDQGRLVVDLPGTSSALQRKVLPVDHTVLKRIRIGTHVDRLRLVFDLPRPITYTVERDQGRIRVRMQAAAVTPGAAKRQGHRGAALRRAPSPRKVARASQPVPTPSASATPVVLRKASRAAMPTVTPPSPKLAQMASGSGGKKYKGRRISLDFQGADITNVLRLIAEVSGLNIVIGDKVKSKVTMKLVNVPWDQALDMLLKINNLGMVREGNILWIDTLANIAKQQNEAAKAEESKLKAEKLITRIVYVKNVKAQDIAATLNKQLSPRGQIQVNKASNALVVQETESKMSEIVLLVEQLDIVSPQVQIEARIVQADTSFSRSLGVQWGLQQVDSSTEGAFQIFGNITGPFNEPDTGSPPTGEFTRSFLVNLPAAVTGLQNVPAVGFNLGRLGDGFDIDLRLSAGELLGLTKVIAAPRITTLDNQEAKIEQGESIPFQTTSLQGTQTTFVDANLTLQVTPQITSRDPKEKAKNILLKVKATRNAVGARSNPAGPSIDKREATTQVLVRNGETVVIGGIFVDSQTNSVGGVPYLSRIPVLGWLFKNKTESVSKQELLIFLTPTIVS